MKLIDRYEQRGECIKLARHGAGAGWLTDEDSWQRCFRCAQRLKQHYARWEDVYVDFQAGREEWWREAAHKPAPAGETEWYARRFAEGNVLIFSKMSLRP